MIGLYGRKQRKGRLETGGIETSRKYGRRGGNQDETLSIDEAAGYKTKVRDVIEKRGKEMLRCEVDEEEHLRIYGGVREEIGMKTYLHGPMDAAKNLKLRFRVGDLDLPERRKDIPVVERRRT